MIKKIILCFVVFVMCILLCGCVGGEHLESKNNVNYRMLINYGSCFVFEFKDADTGVWYICSGKGITPKLNTDGSLYVESEVQGE
jgi:hypothetical protein